MAIAVVVSTIQRGTTDPWTTSAIDTSGADALIAVVAWSPSNGEPTLTDSKGNTWTLRNIATGGFGGEANRIFDCIGPTVGTGHTFTLTGSSADTGIAVLACSGVKQTSPYDQSNQNDFASGATMNPGSVTPTEDNELIVCGLSTIQVSTASIDGGFTELGYLTASNRGIDLAYLIQTTAAAANPTWSFTGGLQFTNGTIATYKAAPASSAVTARVLP